MIQRIQTLWLIISALLIIATATVPVSYFVSDGMDMNMTMYNAVIMDADGQTSFYMPVLPLILLVQFALVVFCIFQYKNRKRQMTVCNVSVLLSVVWIAVCICMSHIMCPEGMAVQYSHMPLLSVITIFTIMLARKGIRHDDGLIRSVDRIR